MELTSLLKINTHEKVVRVEDRPSGLIAFIAIHSTTLGPATGGCRIFNYKSENDALADVLRLSEGMTYKNALAGLKLGGGKSVIVGPLDPNKREEAFIALGRAVGELGGDYVAAEDVGVSVRDIEFMSRSTSFVTGLSSSAHGVGGNPAPYTAYGVFRGIEAAASLVFKRANVAGLRVAIQGVGSVGEKLCKLLSENGAQLIVADTNVSQMEKVCDLYGAQSGEIDNILLSPVDIVAPCAMGRAITEEIATSLRASIVAGAANNQLASAQAGQILYDRKITYAPDYVINAGGIIAAGAEYLGNKSKNVVTDEVGLIYERIYALLLESRNSNTPSHILADKMAQLCLTRKVDCAK